MKSRGGNGSEKYVLNEIISEKNLFYFSALI